MNAFLRLFPRVRELEALLDNALAAKERTDAEIRTAKYELGASEAELNRVAKSLQETVVAKSMLEDRLNAAQEGIGRLWGLVEESLRGERTAYQAHLNLQWQKEGFGAPYPDAPQMPQHKVPREIPNSVVSRPMTGSERMAKGTQDFIAAHAGRWKDATG